MTETEQAQVVNVGTVANGIIDANQNVSVDIFVIACLEAATRAIKAANGYNTVQAIDGLVMTLSEIRKAEAREDLTDGH